MARASAYQEKIDFRILTFNIHLFRRCYFLPLQISRKVNLPLWYQPSYEGVMSPGINDEFISIPLVFILSLFLYFTSVACRNVLGLLNNSNC
jgi:hypothetical protein